MKKTFSILLGIVLIGTIAVITFNEKKVPEIKSDISSILKQAKEAQLDRERWNNIFVQNEKLPSIYPASTIKNSIFEVQKILSEIDQIKLFSQDILAEKIPTQKFLNQFLHLKMIDISLKKIEKNTNKIPEFLLNNTQLTERNQVLTKINEIREHLKDILKFEKIFQKFVDDNSRILILLQNQNEPRSTGGFAGSVIIIDFTEDEIIWHFRDTYSLDRQVPIEKTFPAPKFFHNLSTNISLRDANFWPDFPTTSEKIRHFFKSAKLKEPNVIFAINLNTVKEIMKFTGPVKIEKWNIEFNKHNFDIVLQFLVESKISGRFAVKDPVFDFAKALGAKLKTSPPNIEELKTFDHQKFIEEKNILANAENSTLQKLFEKWQIDGQIRQKKDADNFLHFDFISIGANKSEKFVWTKLWHDSRIQKNGKVRNKLQIIRNHALQPNEINDLLRTNFLYENIKNLINEDLLWKLGAGQNRTILRVHAPINAKLKGYDNPSGDITPEISNDGQFKVFVIPMNVLPGEKLTINLEYETEIPRGSHNWRPYFLQVAGTPGRDKTSFLSTISTKEEGNLSAISETIGRPVSLVDNDFRVVVEFN